MIKKFISLSLSFMLFLSCFANAGGDLSLEEIKILLSTPDKYSKDSATVVAMSVLAGLAKYDEIFTSVNALNEKLAAKEAALEEMQNARLFREGWSVMYDVKGSRGMRANFPALETHYKYQKANVYEPAKEEIYKLRTALLDFPKSEELKSKLQAAEKSFAQTEKNFNALERQYNAARNALLNENVPAAEKALRKEIGLIKSELTRKQPAFSEAQYKIFKEEYQTLMAQLRNKAGLFLPEETDRIVMSLERDLMRFERATTKEDIEFARKALKGSIEKLSKRNAAIQGREMRYYKEALDKFFTNLSRHLNLKSTMPLVAAGGMMIFMLSAQSAQAQSFAFSNRNIIVARQLEYSYIKTPRLMLANAVSLSKCYGPDAVATILYENQEYIPLIQKQVGVLEYVNNNVIKEQNVVNDLVISSKSYQLPQYNTGFGWYRK